MREREVLGTAYGALLRDLEGIGDDVGWRQTRCVGWTVRDLVHHLLTDAQRALVALHSPSSSLVDVDAVTYWESWQPGTVGAEAGRRGTRIMASAWTSVLPIAELYAETAGAVLIAAEERGRHDVVTSQGHTITVPDLLSTLAVEATVHHLDLRLGSPRSPGLAETRRVLDGLLGRSSPIGDDVRWAMVGTGRETPSTDELAALGEDATRLPLFG
ncbi:MAG TPA: maleylpyruvate isomerase N-terminal domain-containing protein [Segeticoccus sp.]|nr:maleylpyruvate isomerase N-terminal domain-containing protein [Segeticoccus sp.]